MKKHPRLLIMILAILSSLSLYACGAAKGSSSDIVGKWVHTTSMGNEQAYIFNEDGTIQLETGLGNATGTYEVAGDTITYTMVYPNNKTKTNTITYKHNGDSLDLTINGNTYNYVKK